MHNISNIKTQRLGSDLRWLPGETKFVKICLEFKNILNKMSCNTALRHKTAPASYGNWVETGSRCSQNAVILRETLT